MKANHICQNKYCTKGEDGKPKHYYACDYCDRTAKWQAFACSIECWNDIVAINNGTYMKPKRTDKTEKEVNDLLNKDIESVKKDTLEQLSDYKEDIEEGGISKAIQTINRELDSKAKGKTAKTNKKSQKKV